MDRFITLSLILAFLSIHSFTEAAKAASTIADRIVEKLPSNSISAGIQYLLYKDCLSANSYLPSLEKGHQLQSICSYSAKTFTEILDISPQNSHIVFSKKLYALSVDENQISFLQNLIGDLYSQKEQKQTYSFWDIVLKNSDNKASALSTMAVLFHNSDPFLDIMSSRTFSKKKFFQYKNSLLFDLTNANPFHRMSVESYPIDNTKFYHFFVPAYITQELLRRDIPPDIAIYMSFAFNWNYEILDDLDFIFHDLKFRERPMEIDKATDIVAAYAGALFGAGLKLDPIKLETLTQKFLINPAHARHDLLMDLKKTLER